MGDKKSLHGHRVKVCKMCVQQWTEGKCVYVGVFYKGSVSLKDQQDFEQANGCKNVGLCI